MKKSNSFRPLHYLLLLAGCVGLAHAAPYGPDGRETQWRQPNGQVVQLRVFGDDFYARTENLDGFTLAFENDTYFYAQASADGKDLVATATLANQPAPAGLRKHLDRPKSEILKIARANLAKLDDATDQRWSKRIDAKQKIRMAAAGARLAKAEVDVAKIDAAPVIGENVGLTILVQFPNDPNTPGADPINFPTDQAKITRFCNQVGYTENGNTGSVRDYFFDQSLGALTYIQTVTTVVTLPRPRNFYNYADYPANRELQDPQIGASELINDAVTILKAQNFDFTSLTVDETGRAVATNVFFAGPDSGNWAQGLWPHASRVVPEIRVGTVAKPITLSRYQITNIESSAPTIGTFCHENGHLLLGYPDLYDLFGEGVGQHCLMGSGNNLNKGKTPAPINIHFKDLVGWATITDLSPNAYRTTSLPTTGNVGYRLTKPRVATEFFMVENRGSGDRWAQYCKDKGIAIWHIDETISGNQLTEHYGVALMQADGRDDLENGVNRGDNTDLFDLITPRFTSGTRPSARWWDNSRSRVDIEVISKVGKNTSVTFGGVPPNTLIVASPDGGEVLYRESNFPVTWQSNIVGNVRIDLHKGGKFLVNLTPNSPNTGTFTWTVPSTLKAGTDYSIVISSVSNPVPTSDVSNGNFAITDVTFPADNKIPYGWFKPKGSTGKWSVTTQDKFEGKTSLAAIKPNDGTVSAIAYRSDFQQGSVGFYIKTSTEKGFDFARFYIDGKAQDFPGFSTARGISGVTDWTFVKFPVSAGTHTFMWTYEKDDSYGDMQDAIWIDGVTMPLGTQQIVVTQATAENLVAGKSQRSFSNTHTKGSSKPMTFTIENRGNADLAGIRVVAVGANSGEFKINNLGSQNLKKGQTTTFDVVFAPKGLGNRKTTILIISNDNDQGRFGIGVSGFALGYPEMAVIQPAGGKLNPGDERKFGTAKLKTLGKTRNFTITNTGSAVLKSLQVKVKGTNASDFKIGSVGGISLAPGASTVVKVTLRPTGTNLRKATLVFKSNDKRTGNFIVQLSGKGAPKGGKKGKSALAAARGSFTGALFGAESASSASPVSASTGLKVIAGQKYLTLTVEKTVGITPGTIQVSSNLVDWFSGKKHTTVLVDDAKTLKVRDNTPTTANSKRYIRLK